MSRENVAAAMRAIEAGNRMDVDGIVAEYRHDAVLRMPLAGPNPGIHEGREAIKRFFEEFYGEWVRFEIEIQEIIELGDNAIVVAHWRARGRHGVEVRQPAAFAYSFKSGQIASVSFFADRDQALKAVGPESGAQDESDSVASR